MPLKLGILSVSVGRATVHSFEAKLEALHANGFSGIELFIEDLEVLAESLPGGLNNDNRIRAAHKIRAICDSRKVEIIDLQPLLFFGGLTDRKEHAIQLEKLNLWFKLVRILGTDLIHVPTNFRGEGVTGDVETIVADMREIADLGLAQKPPVRFVYEAMAWGRFIETWEQAWDIVCRVDRSSFGICLDTFQIAGRIWADPTIACGRIPDGDAILEQSLKRMVSSIGAQPEKLFLVQTGDAQQLSSPLSKHHPLHVDGQPPRMSWSRNARLFAHDPVGGCFLREPVDRVCEVIFNELEYSGWVSCEVYSVTLFDPDPSVPMSHAQRAAEGWRSVLKSLREGRTDASNQHAIIKEVKEVKKGGPGILRVVPISMTIAISIAMVCTVYPLVNAAINLDI